MTARRRKPTGAAGPGTAGRILHLDTFSGIAGNMFLGALLDAGLSRKELEADLAGLGLEHRLKVSRVTRGALAARYLDVLVPDASKGGMTSADHLTFDEPKPKPMSRSARKQKLPVPKRGRRPSRAGKGSGARGSSKGHDHDHHHTHDHAPHAHGRAFSDIVALLGRAKLAPRVRERAESIFEALARAEARVHGVGIEDVHFHEVGAVDAIVDITGAAIALERLEIGRVTATPVALGEGFVDTQHGRLPVPAPATLELLRGLPTVPAHVAFETVTPTGAAILRCIVDEFRSLPAMTVESIGHGAGRDRQGGLPNVLRAVLGRDGGYTRDRIVVLESHLDDLIPEHFDYLMESLFEAGALDVSLQHLQMKKNRPGYALRILARPSDRLALARLLFAESTAIGVRVHESERYVLRRETRKVATAYGKLGVKLVWDEAGQVSVSAEHDDCKAAARKHGAALRDVVRAAEEAGRALGSDD